MSESLPADVRAVLTLVRPLGRAARFYAGESVRATATFTDAQTGAAVEVSGITFAFGRPDLSEAIAPEGFAVRLGVGVWACALVPVLPGTWSVVARCLSPTAAVAVASFDIAPLPAGAQPPPANLVTSDDGLFLLLTPDGAAITL